MPRRMTEQRHHDREAEEEAGNRPDHQQNGNDQTPFSGCDWILATTHIDVIMALMMSVVLVEHQRGRREADAQGDGSQRECDADKYK